MQYLLERLASAGKTIDLAEAVRQQVQRLVGIHIREGDLGLDLMDLAFTPLADVHNRNELGQLTARLHALIARNEPRLTVVRVDVEPLVGTGRNAKLTIVGRLRGEIETRSLSLELSQH